MAHASPVHYSPPMLDAAGTDGSGAAAGLSSERFVWAIAAGSLLLGLLGAGLLPLTDPDEGRYAEIAREMAVGGDWLVPHLFDIPYLEKPPLLFWLTATSFRLLGVGEASARLVPLFATAIGIVLVGRFASRTFSPRAGVASSAVLALSGLYAVVGRTLLVDTLFAVTLAGALFAFCEFRARPSSRSALAFWIALALSVLTKGPAALVIAGLAIAIDCGWAREWRTLCAPSLLSAAPAFAMLVVPWFLLVQARHPDFLAFYLWKEHLQRAAGAEHREPFWFFVPWLAIGFLPWTPLACVLAPSWGSAARGTSHEARAVRFLVVWAAVVFVLFSAARGKLVTYILPMFPPLAVLVGYTLDRALARDSASREFGWALVAVAGLFAAASVALVLAWFRFEAELGLVPSIVLPVVLAAGATVIVRDHAKSPARSVVALAATTGAALVVLTAAEPALSRTFTAKPLLDRMAAEMGPEDHYLMYGEYLPSAVFYLGRKPLLVGLRPELRYGAALGGAVNVAKDWPELRAWAKGRPLYVLTDTKKKREKELRFLLGRQIVMLARTHKQALWLRP